MYRLILLLATFYFSFIALAQNDGTIELRIRNNLQIPLAHTTVELLRHPDSFLVKVGMTDTAGVVRFSNIVTGSYWFRITRVGYATHSTGTYSIQSTTSQQLPPVVLHAVNATLQNVTVVARKPFVELLPDKTVINLEAGISNTGTTVLEALEKLPGISVDKDGNISLKGKSGVLVLIDGKQTYLDPAQLAALLGGLSTAQLSQVEIMDQPPAKYDAAGNAGIINIKTKKNQQRGFNASISTAYSQGVYYKNFNSLQLNYRSGKFNYFLNYSLNTTQNFTRIDALRRYYKDDGYTLARQLEQPSFIRGKGYTDNLRTGADYFLNSKTTFGVSLNGLLLTRSSGGNNTALWMKADRTTDSLIQTQSRSNNQLKNGGVNLSLQHQFSAAQNLSADVDVLGYHIDGRQYFNNDLVFPGSYSEATRAVIPSTINIVSAKADYSQQVQKIKMEAGWKSSHITTDNMANYEYLDANTWKPDYGKTNHFRYRENIHAVYTGAQTILDRWSLQGGLRYELTNYKAKQLGNAMRKDSAFSRSYNNLFPTLFVSFAVDSSNSFNLSAGRRIDRPAFQKLNPFVFIINKYTYQKGNPFFRPQYTWNLELNHLYKNVLTSGISYSITKDYFSQIFPIDSTGIVLYTEGNLGRMHNLGLSAGVQLSPLKWWSFSAQAVVNNKKMEGVVWKDYSASITQLTVNTISQFRFQKGWAAELSGNYTSRSQHDLQEIVDPAGQLSIGISKAILKNKGTVKLAARDLFYTQWMKGLTYFDRADEYFKLTRDTRVATLSFTWRFGKAVKTTKRSSGAATDEIQRVGAG